MRTFLKKEVLIALTIVLAAFAAMTVTFHVAGQRMKDSYQNAKMEVSFTEPEENSEDSWYETIDDTISDTVDAYEMEGTSYTIDDETEIDDGYYVTVNTSDESTVVSGLCLDGKYYIVTLKSDDKISHAQAERMLYDRVCTNIMIA